MGWGDLNKFRWLLFKLRKDVQLGGIALLHETHIVENLTKLYWKTNLIPSCMSTNRGGVECVESHTDNKGRVAIVVMEIVYCPNNHKACYVLMEKVYDKIFDLLENILILFWNGK
jgi:hypothetical protein